MKKDSEEICEIQIPQPLYDKIMERIRDTEFGSVGEYIAFVLEEILSEEREEVKEETFTEEDEEKVKERLRRLGYL